MGWVLWTRWRRLWSRLRGAGRASHQQCVESRAVTPVLQGVLVSPQFWRPEPSWRVASARSSVGETSPPEFQTLALAPGTQSLAAFQAAQPRRLPAKAADIHVRGSDRRLASAPCDAGGPPDADEPPVVAPKEPV